MSGKVSVREKFSLEFVTGADAEVTALKSLFAVANKLPDLVLFDTDAIQAPPVQAASPEPVQVAEIDEDADPVAELRMLFGSVQ